MKALVNSEMNLRVHKDQFSFSWVGGFTNTYGNSQNMMTLFSRPSFVHFCLCCFFFFFFFSLMPQRKLTLYLGGDRNQETSFQAKYL